MTNLAKELAQPQCPTKRVALTKQMFNPIPPIIRKAHVNTSVFKNSNAMNWPAIAPNAYGSRQSIIAPHSFMEHAQININVDRRK